MKTFFTAVLLIFIIGNTGAADIESYRFIDYLRAIPGPGKPAIYEDAVVFTVPSSYQRAGISFAHEDYARVHWFRRLMVPGEPAAAGGNAETVPDVDSGIMFHLQAIPAGLTAMDYRLIVGGLWTSDPLNPETVRGPAGIAESRVLLPTAPGAVLAETPAPGSHRFVYRAEPGATVTVGGSFNNWDPFMYTLAETSPGFYTLTLPLPPGSFQYVFFHRGEAVPDPENPRKLYTENGRVVSAGG